MRQFAWRDAIPAALAFALFGCAQQGTDAAKLAAGQRLEITKKVWEDYQEYVKRGRSLGPDRNGAFGLVIVGDLGVVGLYSYRYCPREYDGCRPGGPTAVGDILGECRTEQVECLIFARNEEIQVPYEIIE